MEPTHRAVPGASDLSLNLVQWSQEGEPLLMLHGFGHSARVWDPMAKSLAAKYQCLALDLRGHGDSDYDPSFNYHHVMIGKDLISVLDHLEIPQATIVAHSTSGHALIGLAARFPDRLKRLVLVDAGAQLKGKGGGGGGDASFEPVCKRPEQYAKMLKMMYRRASMDTLETLAHHWLKQRDDGMWIPKLDPGFYKPKSKEDPKHKKDFDREAWAKKEEGKLWADVAKITCPTLVVRGAESKMLSEPTVQKMCEIMPNAEGAAVEGASHNIMIDNPAGMTDALNKYLL